MPPEKDRGGDTQYTTRRQNTRSTSTALSYRLFPLLRNYHNTHSLSDMNGAACRPRRAGSRSQADSNPAPSSPLAAKVRNGVGEREARVDNDAARGAAPASVEGAQVGGRRAVKAREPELLEDQLVEPAIADGAMDGARGGVAPV